MRVSFRPISCLSSLLSMFVLAAGTCATGEKDDSRRGDQRIGVRSERQQGADLAGNAALRGAGGGAVVVRESLADQRAAAAGIVAGTARVYVRSSTGIDSNAGLITISP